MWWHDPVFPGGGNYVINETDIPEISNDDVEVKKTRVNASHVTLQLIP